MQKPTVCHLAIPETVIPGYSEIHLPHCLSGEQDVVQHRHLAVLDPAPEFMERHGVLIAHSLSYTGTDGALVQILNPSPVLVLVHQNERVGELQGTLKLSVH